MVEVFTLTWNSERTIEKCLECINEVIPNAYITLIDRYSRDRTVEIAKSYGAKVIQSNLNVGEATSLICRLAVGDWFLLVHSDIYVTHDWFKDLIAEKKRLEKEGVKIGAIGGEGISIYEPMRSLMFYDRTKKSYPYTPKRFVQAMNCMLRKEAVQGFNINASTYEDYLLGKYIQDKGYRVLVVRALAQHDAYKTMDSLKKHCRWSAAGMRRYQKVPLWKMLAAFIYEPLFTVPKRFVRLQFFLQWNWLLGYLLSNHYLELRR